MGTRRIAAIHRKQPTPEDLVQQLNTVLAVRGMATQRVNGMTVLYKTANVPANLGKSPELVLAELVASLGQQDFDIRR